MYKTRFHKEKALQKDISKIPPKTASSILDEVELFAQKGLPDSQVKRLSNYDLCNYRLRVGNYRVLFDIDEEEKEIVIFRILHRSKFY